MPTIHSDTLFIEPLDVLILRGNKLFADAGSHGEALMPPWPSVAAGALRSRMLTDADIDALAFADGKATLGAALAPVLGSVERPGAFRIVHFGLARRSTTAAPATCELLLPMPADISVNDDGLAHALQPTQLYSSLKSSYPLALTPTLLQPNVGKPKSGLWLTAAGLAAWQRGEALHAPQQHWVSTADLWAVESRLGIALEAGRNIAAQGQLYTSEVIALKPEVGFVVRVAGTDGLLPSSGLLRFGGDGHAASLSACTAPLPHANHDAITRSGRFRLMLTSPGIFLEGWRLPGTDSAGRWHFHGASARLASATLPRLETLSGWDIARRRPKPAVRAVATGSVYWLDDFQGEPAALEALTHLGIPSADASRRAEGFNNCLLAEWR